MRPNFAFVSTSFGFGPVSKAVSVAGALKARPLVGSDAAVPVSYTHLTLPTIYSV